MAGRRTSLASLAGAKVDDVPGRSDPLLLTLPLAQLVPTRFNPRRNFGTDEDLKAFGLILKKRQLQPAVVVSRTGYLKLWPGEEVNVGAVSYVIANGERRYRGSLAAGLTTLNVVHNEGVATSRADFLDAVLSENNDRQDLDPIERALGIETMVAELGGADQVAAHYSKSKGWVSQQRKLLKLTLQLQDLVSAGELPVRVARDIAGLPQGEQAAAWAAEQHRRTESRAAPRVRQPPAAPAPAPSPAVAQVPPTPAQPVRDDPSWFTAVNQSSGGQGNPEPPNATGTPPARAPQPAETSPPSLPEPRPAAAPAPRPPVPTGEAPPARRLPALGWDVLAEALIEELPLEDRHRLTARLWRLMTEEKSPFQSA